MTTILSIRRNNNLVFGGDGQVTLGSTIIKHDVQKIKKIYNNNILCGLAGGTADAFILFECLEKKIQNNNGNLIKSAIDLIKDWRSDRYLRRLEAMLGVADSSNSFILTGNGELIKPDDDIIAIGSGGSFAKSAARALLENTELSALDIVKKSIKIASDLCIYTNDCISIKQISY